MNASSGQPSMRDRKKRRWAARARMFRSARARAFREHPVVSWTSVGLVAIGIGSLATDAAFSAGREGTRQPCLEWIGVACLALPLVWMTAVLHLGPFSRKRRSRAEFWGATRFTLWAMSAGIVFGLLWFAIELVYESTSIAKLFGQTAPSFLWGKLWRRVDQPGAIWYLGPSIAAALVMLYAAHRLKPVVRRLEGKCVRCGYLLRGLTEPRCPECGTPFNPDDLPGYRLRRESAPADRPGG
jgi:hypothetical protein